MFKTEDVLEAARTIRPFLSELLGEDATRVDEELARLLESGQRGEKVDNFILNLLAQNDATREWMNKFLGLRQPQDTTRGFRPVPGYLPPPALEKYVCPENDYVWFRHSVSVKIPSCPTHPNMKLVLAKEQ